jgi:hypothetical protein
MTIARSTIIAVVATAALVAQSGLAASKSVITVMSGPITKNKATSSTTPHPPAPHAPAVTQITKPKNVPATAQNALGHPH